MVGAKLDAGSRVLPLPLLPGDDGPGVQDLQRRLAALDLPCGEDPPGRFGPATASAVVAFQRQAGLDVDGKVGRVTWQAVVEAGYRLGDRQLYHRSPMMRGDDVAELQRRLGALGFDAGRVDGIFGPLTSHALMEFQRNTGLGVDGIFGPDSALALGRLGRGRTSAVNVAHVREVERLRGAPRRLAGRRIAVGEPGGLGALVATISHELRDRGAVVAILDHPDGSAQAREANDFAADVYLGLRLLGTVGQRVAFFQTAGFESTGGRWLAELVSSELKQCLHCGGQGAVGRRLPVLRETRMPAVLCEAGPPEIVVERAAPLARAVVDAVSRWVAEPMPHTETSSGAPDGAGAGWVAPTPPRG
jgi:N-acetylmuramoyl-L-alanine amidase